MEVFAPQITRITKEEGFIELQWIDLRDSSRKHGLENPVKKGGS